jgi:Cu-Zn family superoxide dismutase
MRRVAMLVVLLAAGLGADLGAQQLPTAVARLIDRHGREVGVVQLQETPVKGVLIRIEVTGLSAGSHGIHIHSVGRCEGPSFESAGEHFNPRNHSHGARSPNGMHAGDLINLEVPGPGRMEAERLARGVTLASGLLNSLVDEDGSAIVIHENGDDNVTQPSGNAGARVVCGVIHR